MAIATTSTEQCARAVTSAGVLRHLQLATSHPLGEGKAMSDYYDLGTYSRPVTTNSPAAQLWFDRGLLWCYGYNHEEAVRCFRRAAEHDNGCAMAYWGIAHASGSNYNKRWEAFAEEEWQEALAVARRATEDARARLGECNAGGAGADPGAGAALPVGAGAEH